MQPQNVARPLACVLVRVPTRWLILRQSPRPYLERPCRKSAFSSGDQGIPWEKTGGGIRLDLEVGSGRYLGKIFSKIFPQVWKTGKRLPMRAPGRVGRDCGAPGGCDSSLGPPAPSSVESGSVVRLPLSPHMPSLPPSRTRASRVSHLWTGWGRRSPEPGPPSRAG